MTARGCRRMNQAMWRGHVAPGEFSRRRFFSARGYARPPRRSRASSLSISRAAGPSCNVLIRSAAFIATEDAADHIAYLMRNAKREFVRLLGRNCLLALPDVADIGASFDLASAIAMPDGSSVTRQAFNLFSLQGEIIIKQFTDRGSTSKWLQHGCLSSTMRRSF